MEITALKSQIQSKKLDSFYVFIGDEWEVQKIYIKQMSKVSGKSIRYVDSVVGVFTACRNTSFITSAYVYVVLDDNEFEKNESLQQRIHDVLKDNILILVYTKADKRKKLFKDSVTFESLKPEVLRKYIKKSISLSDKYADKLAEVCEYNYGRCLLEADKINCYATAQSCTVDKACHELLVDGTIHQDKQDTVFDFVDAVMKRNSRCFDLIPEDNVMGLLQLLYNNCKAVFAIQECKGKDVAKVSGIDARHLYYARDKVNHYHSDDLVHAMRLIQGLQEGIITGKIEEQFVLDYLLVNVL